MNEDFRKRINRFVRDLLHGYAPTATQAKTIHDPIWGSVEFHPWEVRIIDSPLFQRLRDINQVGLAETTYPAARHTRFTHSLGTCAIASRMAQRLYADAREREEVREVIGDGEIRLLRLAALLHDVGHCPYSHLSEAIYGKMPEFEPIRAAAIAECGQPINPSPHEIFSYFVITSEAFVAFFHRHVAYPHVETAADARDLLHRAARMIVGAVNETDRGRLSYLTEVLNGNFDADKLDYTQRDSYTAGIALTYGVERFLLKSVICRTEAGGVADYRLALTADALSTVEELMFNRSMLYHYIYRHQKVLSAESQMRDALYALVKVGRISHPCDFLTLSDGDIDALYRSRRQPYAPYGARRNKTLKHLMEALNHRSLMKRALELSPDSFEEYQLPKRQMEQVLEALEGDGKKEDILEDFLHGWQRRTLFPQGIADYIAFLNRCTPEDYIAERQTVAARIADAYRAAGKKVDFDAFDLALSFQPPLKSDLTLTITDKKRRLIHADGTILRMERWLEALNLSKWRGYLFVAPHVDRKLAGAAFAAYLKEKCAED